MNYYSVLGVSKNASQSEIKQAYRKLAMKHHPDRGGDAGKLSEINSAYEILGDPTKRAEYDNPQPRFTSNNFNQAFTEGFYRQQVYRNGDTALIAEITLADVVNGKDLFASYRLGSGREDTIEVRVPVGIQDGQILRFKGKGDDRYPGPRGCLLIKIVVRPVKNWDRQENNLVLTYKVNAIDMMLGTRVTVTTLDNKKIELKIPEGTQSDTKFSVPGYGLPDPRTGKVGNLYIKVVPEIEKIQDPDVKEKLRNYRNATKAS